jgi:hypothetical protein
MACKHGAMLKGAKRKQVDFHDRYYSSEQGGNSKEKFTEMSPA